MIHMNLLHNLKKYKINKKKKRGRKYVIIKSKKYEKMEKRTKKKKRNYQIINCYRYKQGI